MIDLSYIVLIFRSCLSTMMAYPLHPTFSFEDPTMLAYANLPVEKSAHPSPKATTVVEEYELASRESSHTAPAEHDSEETARVLKKAYRKFDIRLLAWYTIALIVMGIENTSIAKSAIMNVEARTDIKHELGDLTDVQWAHVVGASFYTSLFFQPISALFLKRCTPRIWIGGLMLMWAVIAVCTSAVQNFSEIFVCRLLLGMESGLMPAIIYHISFWYPADILPLRIALCAAFYMSAGCVRSLLTFAIAHMNNVGGLSGWRWLFILLGLPALLCAIYTLLTLPNYPQDAKFFTAAERDAILTNMPKTQPSKHDKAWDWSQVKALLKEPSTYTFWSRIRSLNTSLSRSVSCLLSAYSQFCSRSAFERQTEPPGRRLGSE
jgi:MFS family permease